MTKLEQEIKREAAACRAALKDSKVGDLVGHCHHREFLEILNEPAENRISYILFYKPKEEQPERLRRFRPIDPKKVPSGLKKARAEWEKARKEWEKVRDEWYKARAVWLKTGPFAPDLDKVYAEWDKANAELKKAFAKWDKARTEWGKACFSPEAVKLHAEVCGCPWGEGTDIFGENYGN